ncbi:unnamed protein product [Mytilus coruscus]|uniref:Uncharacterized protein n=1 Tax=Mytilus coruscus TaxID=42192 RepID=A0A6J8B8R4_MYTCO|nr:unnamed protein product [Mytilus coruscus]
MNAPSGTTAAVNRSCDPTFKMADEKSWLLINIRDVIQKADRCIRNDNLQPELVGLEINRTTDMLAISKDIRLDNRFYIEAIFSQLTVVAERIKMATASSYKNPPGLTKDKSYQQWKNEVKMWQLVTDLDKKKRGLALALSIQGKPREVVLEVDPSDLNVDEGVDKLITELDKLFEKDKIDQAYAAYTVFDQFHRGEDVSMSDYITEFEQRYNKCKKYDMGLPDAILAFKLLDNAGLSQSYRQLALTACSDLKFDTMKSALNRIFASKSQNVPGERDSVVTVKEESAFVSNGYYQRGHSSRRNFPRNRADRSTNFSRLKTKMNPVFNEHESDELNETVNITLLTSAQEFKPLTVFVAEAYNAAVIDTACSKTVCGSKWLYEFVESLDPGLDQITCFLSHVPFKFGDGQTVYSYQKVKIPALIGSVKCSIETEVVDCEIPLLLSKTSLKRASTILDLRNDKVTMFGQLVDAITLAGNTQGGISQIETGYEVCQIRTDIVFSGP